MKKVLLFLFFILLNNNSNAQTYCKITVAQDGSGDETSISDAITTACVDHDWNLIYIKKGIYREKIEIYSPHMILIGEDKENTIIINDDYSGKPNPKSNRNFGTSDSYTLLVDADDVRIENITIQNSWCDKGQAVALRVKGNRFMMKNSKILGCQDTLLTDGDGTYQYYENCYIDGTTDFIFGPAVAVFQNCIINSKKDSYITAASTPENQEFGYVFMNCKLIADANATKVFLGRPWRPYA